MDSGDNQGISLLGNANSYYEGTVYAPNNLIEVGGGSNLMSNIGVQVIGENIKIHGNINLNIQYDASKMYHSPVRLDLNK